MFSDGANLSHETGGMQAMKRPTGRGELVLYLDFDGVLHHENVHWHPRKGTYLDAPEGYSLFQHAALLETLLAPYPAVRIVLSTSWVRVFSYSRAAKRLTPALRARVIGATYHSTMRAQDFAAMPRGYQVWDDVQRRQPRDWLALDDDAQDWPDWCRDRLVHTHEHAGLSEPAVHAELRDKLAAMCASTA